MIAPCTFNYDLSNEADVFEATYDHGPVLMRRGAIRGGGEPALCGPLSLPRLPTGIGDRTCPGNGRVEVVIYGQGRDEELYGTCGEWKEFHSSLLPDLR